MMAEEIAGVGHWSMDVASRAITWSDAIYRIYGVPLGAPVPRTGEMLALYPPSDRDAIGAAMVRSVVDGGPFHGYKASAHPQGRRGSANNVSLRRTAAFGTRTPTHQRSSRTPSAHADGHDRGASHSAMTETA